LIFCYSNAILVVNIHTSYPWLINNSSCSIITLHEPIHDIDWRLVHRINFGDNTNGFGIALSHHHLSSFIYYFNAIFELESYCRSIIRPHAIFVVQWNSLNCLTDTSNVHHGLVTFLDCCVMMQNFDSGIKILTNVRVIGVNALSLHWVNQTNTFSNMISLYWLFASNIDTDRLSWSSFCYRNSIFMNSFDDDKLEVTVLIWSKHHLLVKLDMSFNYDTTQNKAKRFRHELRVNNKLSRYFSVSAFLTVCYCFLNILNPKGWLTNSF